MGGIGAWVPFLRGPGAAAITRSDGLELLGGLRIVSKLCGESGWFGGTAHFCEMAYCPPIRIAAIG